MRECLAIKAARSLSSRDVILTLSRLMRLYGKPRFVRSDQGAEFTASRVMCWLRDQKIGLVFFEAGRPWQNGWPPMVRAHAIRAQLGRVAAAARWIIAVFCN